MSSFPRLPVLAFAVALGLATPAWAQVADGAYHVNPGDTLTVTAYGNAALSGLFPVDNSGTIGYPIIGHVAVAGMTTPQIGDAITKALVEHVAGLTVTVSINSYAPVFVLGDVQAPGSYQYRPGMIALELLALGGGTRRAQDNAQNLGLQFITTRQQYTDLTLQLFSLRVKQARIEAERDGAAFTFDIPADANPADRQTMAAIIAAERNIMAVRARTAKAEDDGLSAQETSFKTEIATIEEGIRLQNEEITSLEADVASAQSLVDRGLATDTSLRTIQRNLSATKRDSLELQSARAKAEQNLLDLGLRKTVLANDRQNQAAESLRDLEIEISRDTATLTSLVDTMGEIASLDAQAVSRMQPLETQYSIIRVVDGRRIQLTADQMTPILPGDILQAESVLPAPVTAEADQ
jgi:polysaccharide export outer membrane protein